MSVHSDPTPPARTPIEERLRAWECGELDRIAVTMLLEEQDLLARPGLQRILVVLADDAVYADWTHLSLRLDKLDLDEEELQFLEILLAIALGRQILLDSVRCLDERRLAVALRALASWAGCDSIAVGTRS
ncbi:hypothetical protein [Streptomyces lasiicapitis]|uniref:hypothetical protein n=1 Tax=Streptomyces lasiicapitis TaxID=1923961 RepID=UPI003648C2BD